MSSSPFEPLLFVARYSWYRLKRRVVMALTNAQIPPCGIKTEKGPVSAYRNVLRSSVYDISKIHLGDVSFKKFGNSVEHEFIHFKILYEGNHIATGLMERSWRRPEERNSRVSGATSTVPTRMTESAVLAGSVIESASNDFDAIDTISINTLDIPDSPELRLAKVIGTYTPPISSLEYSLAKLVIIGEAVGSIAPKYKIFSTNCYYFAAIVSELIVQVMGGVFVATERSPMGKYSIFRIVDRETDKFEEAVRKAKQAFDEKWQEFLEEPNVYKLTNALERQKEENRELRERDRKREEEMEHLRAQLREQAVHVSQSSPAGTSSA